MGRSMWNDEDRRDPDRERHKVASSWALVAVILVAAAAWSGLHYLAIVAESIFGSNTMPEQAISPVEEGIGSRDSTAGCTAAGKRIQGERTMGREQRAGDARPSSPEIPGCESNSTRSFDLPGPALVVEWESLR
jgi:hypothetical protein